MFVCGELDGGVGNDAQAVDAVATHEARKALFLPSRGGKFELGESPIPRPGPQDLLVKVQSAALNPIDWKVTGGPRFSAIISKYPHVCGFDGAGVVQRVGSEVASLVEGDNMYVLLGSRSHRTY